MNDGMESITLEGRSGVYLWKATVEPKISNKNIFGRFISELFVCTNKKHKLIFRNGKIRLNTLDGAILNAIAKEIEIEVDAMMGG